MRGRERERDEGDGISIQLLRDRRRCAATRTTANGAAFASPTTSPRPLEPRLDPSHPRKGKTEANTNSGYRLQCKSNEEEHCKGAFVGFSPGSTYNGDNNTVTMYFAQSVWEPHP